MKPPPVYVDVSALICCAHALSSQQAAKSRERWALTQETCAKKKEKVDGLCFSLLDRDALENRQCAERK